MRVVLSLLLVFLAAPARSQTTSTINAYLSQFLREHSTGMSERYAGTFSRLPEPLRTRAEKALPKHRFVIADMFYTHWGPDEVKILLVFGCVVNSGDRLQLVTLVLEPLRVFRFDSDRLSSRFGRGGDDDSQDGGRSPGCHSDVRSRPRSPSGQSDRSGLKPGRQALPIRARSVHHSAWLRTPRTDQPDHAEGGQNRGLSISQAVSERLAKRSRGGAEKKPREDMLAKFWLACPSLAESRGFPAHELRTLTRIVAKHREKFAEAWDEHFRS
jgi:hypothetical protein